MEDLMIALIYVIYFSAFMLAVCLASWAVENIPFLSKLMDKYIDYISYSSREED